MAQTVDAWAPIQEPDAAGRGFFEQLLGALCSQMVLLTASPLPALRLSPATLAFSRRSGLPENECTLRY